MTDFIQWGPPQDYSDIEMTTSHASTEVGDDDEVMWTFVGETIMLGMMPPEVERVEDETNRDPYCERFMRGEVQTWTISDANCYSGKSRR